MIKVFGVGKNASVTVQISSDFGIGILEDYSDPELDYLIIVDLGDVVELEAHRRRFKESPLKKLLIISQRESLLLPEQDGLEVRIVPFTDTANVQLYINSMKEWDLGVGGELVN